MAFTVAAEEISHFHYLLYHASRTRQVSQLELELQGDIDKFLLTYFANFWKMESSEEIFDALFELLFYRFRLAENLGPEERSRYLEANNLARRFIRKCATSLSDSEQRERIFRQLRKFYRLGASEKISFISG